jgi:hypothetical protein
LRRASRESTLRPAGVASVESSVRIASSMRSWIIARSSSLLDRLVSVSCSTARAEALAASACVVLYRWKAPLSAGDARLLLPNMLSGDVALSKRSSVSSGGVSSVSVVASP